MTGWLMTKKLSELRAGARFSIMVFSGLRGAGRQEKTGQGSIFEIAFLPGTNDIQLISPSNAPKPLNVAL